MNLNLTQNESVMDAAMLFAVKVQSLENSLAAQKKAYEIELEIWLQEIETARLERLNA